MRRLLRAAATPQVLVPLLLLTFALTLLLGAPRRPAPSPVTLQLQAPKPALSEQEVTIVVVDEVGLERATSLRMQLPPEGSQRLTAVLARLREASLQQGVWPAELPAPRAFVFSQGSGRVAVVDMLVPHPVGVSVQQESALLRSLQATAQRAGATEVRFLRNGLPTDTLLAHVAVPSAL